MKRILGIMLAFALTLGVVESAIAEKKQATCNEAYDATEMVSAAGEKIKLPDEEQLLGDKYMGLALMPHDLWMDLAEAGSLQAWVYSGLGISFEYVQEEYVKKGAALDEKDNAGYEAWLQEVEEKSCKALFIYRVNDEIEADSEFQQILTHMKERYAHTEPLGEIGSDRYFIAFNDKFDQAKLTETDKKLLDELIKDLAKVRDEVMLFPAHPEPAGGGAEEAKGDLPDEEAADIDLTRFTAKDLAGKEHTQEMLKGYDLTMVNVWTTWCGPCVGEMPELAGFYKQLPKNVNMITICADADEEAELAREILADAKAEFITLTPGDDLKQVIDSVYAYPTTFFVDSEGRLIEGDAAKLVGAPQDVLKDYTEQIEKNLKALRK